MANLSGLGGYDDRRRSRFVADNKFDSTPTYPPFFARSWTTAPTEKDIGGFGVDASGRLVSADGTQFMPAVGNRPIFGGAAKVLGPGDAGAICRFTTAAGYLYTLPTPRPGMFFEFHVDITITSVGAKIVTATPASEFLLGWFRQSTDGTYTMATHSANGTTHVSWNGNGTTTGGLLGDVIYVAALSTTQWLVWGYGTATGAEATPFATS